MNQDDANKFTTSMMAQFHGVIVEQSTLSAVSTDLVGIDLTAIIPDDGIALGPLVYLRGGLGPRERVLTVTHMCQLVSRFWRNSLEFAWLYLTEPEARVRYEAEAIRAELEVQFLYGLPMPTLDQLRDRLGDGYALDKTSIDLGVALLEVALTTVDSGIVSTEAGIHAVSLLKLHGHV